VTWLKLWATAWKHPKMVALKNDSERYAYIVALQEQKALGGKPFYTPRHFAVCVGPYAKHLKALLAVGLMDRLADGSLTVHDFDERQAPIDPKGGERQRRWRLRQQGIDPDASPPGSPPVDNAVSDAVTDEQRNAVSDSLRVTDKNRNRVEGDRVVPINGTPGSSIQTVTPGARSRSKLKPEAVAARAHREQVQGFVAGFGIAGKGSE